MEKKKQSAEENPMTDPKNALARTPGKKAGGGVVHHRKKEHLFLCFWDIVLDNLPSRHVFSSLDSEGRRPVPCGAGTTRRSFALRVKR